MSAVLASSSARLASSALMSASTDSARFWRLSSMFNALATRSSDCARSFAKSSFAAASSASLSSRPRALASMAATRALSCSRSASTSLALPLSASFAVFRRCLYCSSSCPFCSSEAFVSKMPIFGAATDVSTSTGGELTGVTSGAWTASSFRTSSACSGCPSSSGWGASSTAGCAFLRLKNENLPAFCGSTSEAASSDT